MYFIDEIIQKKQRIKLDLKFTLELHNNCNFSIHYFGLYIQYRYFEGKII